MEATQVKTQTQQNAPAQFKPPKKKRRWVRRLVAVLVVAAILAVLLLRLMSAADKDMIDNDNDSVAGVCSLLEEMLAPAGAAGCDRSAIETR